MAADIANMTASLTKYEGLLAHALLMITVTLLSTSASLQILLLHARKHIFERFGRFERFECVSAQHVARSARLELMSLA